MIVKLDGKLSAGKTGFNEIYIYIYTVSRSDEIVCGGVRDAIDTVMEWASRWGMLVNKSKYDDIHTHTSFHMLFRCNLRGKIKFLTTALLVRYLWYYIAFLKPILTYGSLFLLQYN